MKAHDVQRKRKLLISLWAISEHIASEFKRIQNSGNDILWPFVIYYALNVMNRNTQKQQTTHSVCFCLSTSTEIHSVTQTNANTAAHHYYILYTDTHTQWRGETIRNSDKKRFISSFQICIKLFSNMNYFGKPNVVGDKLKRIGLFGGVFVLFLKITA